MTGLRGFGWAYDTQPGVIRDWVTDAQGVRRYVDNNEPLPGEVLKGNADLVPAQHQTLEQQK